MHNILVTGANGQLGNSIRQLAASTSDNYIFTDVAELDITDRAAIRQLVAQKQIDRMINCAAYTNVEQAEEDFATADLLNNRAVANLAIVAREVGALLIHVSTDYVFSGEAHRPYREEQPTAPLGVYGKTKLAGEVAIQDSGCNYVIIRTAWLYSEFGNNFVKTMLRLTAEREKLSVVFDQIGTPTYAGDLVAAILRIIDSEQAAGSRELYHFTDEGVCSWYDFAYEIARLAGRKCRINPCHTSEFPTKAVRPAYSVLDKTKIKNTFGLTIPNWRESLEKCIVKLK